MDVAYRLSAFTLGSLPSVLLCPKSAKVVTLPNADHYVFFSNEQEVEKDIKDFLATLNTKEN